MGFLLKSIMAFDGLLGRMWDHILSTAPTQPEPQPPPKIFHDPSGKFMRAKLAGWIDENKYEQYQVVVEGVDYRVMFIPLRSTWYSVAYFYNRQKLPALGAFVRGKKDHMEMHDFIESERRRKRMETLLIELRDKDKKRKEGDRHAHH